MTRSNKKQPTDKKPVVANKELWRELTEGLQGKVRGGVLDANDPQILAGQNICLGNGCDGDDT